jgi:peptidoglycan/LPS O-acetylase OafA/YrhL
MFLLGYWLVGGNWVGASGKILVPYFDLTIAVQAYLVSIVLVLASIATSLALGVKNFLIALPSGLFLFYALAVMGFSAKFIDERPIYASMLFFLIFATGVPLLIRSCKDEERKQKIYQGALLLMLLMSLLAVFAALKYLVAGSDITRYFCQYLSRAAS